MKLNISKNELLNALTIVSKATSNRPTIPILAGILIDVDKDAIHFYGTDLETSIQTTVTGLVEEPGRTVVSGKIFTDIIRALPDASVLLEKVGESLVIKAQQSSFTIHTLDPEDFARFPDVEGIDEVSLPVEVVEDMVRKVGKAVSRDETRAVLTGILLQIDNTNIKMVATDSYRLAVVEKELDKPIIAEHFEALVPGRALDDVIKMARKGSTLDITLTSNQVRFIFDQTVFITRRIEGNYPNYQNLLPDHYNTKVILSSAEIMEATKRVSLMALNNTALKLSVFVEDQTLMMTSSSHDYGQAEEALMAKIEGEDREISVNHGYLLDGLSVIGSDFVTLEIQESMKPGILRCEEENFIYLFMPVRPS